MQYLLTEAEFDELKVGNQKRLDDSKTTIQRLCIIAANLIPLDELRSGQYGSRSSSAWGCRLTTPEMKKAFHLEDHMPGTMYCDKCPVRSMCPSDKKELSR